MGIKFREVLVRALKKLEESSFQRFIEKLSVWEVREEYTKIPKDELTGKNPEHVAGLIIKYYKHAYGAELTLAVLEDIDEKKVREELQHDLREVDSSGHGLGTVRFTDRVNFIDHHQLNLEWMLINDPILQALQRQDLLTQEQYDKVSGKPTSQEKMEELCEIIRHWEEAEKYTAYSVLRRNYEKIIIAMENERTRRNTHQQLIWGHFVDRHRSHLTYNIKEVNPVLDDLRSSLLLTEENYTRLQAMTTTVEKMRNLIHILWHETDTVKDQFYYYLWRHNYTVINNLENSERMGKIPEAGDHFIDRHKQELITRIHEIYPIINDLYINKWLKEEERDYIMSIPLSEERMRRLFAIIRDWDDNDKDEVYRIFYQHIPSVIDDLKMLDDFFKFKKQRTSKTSLMSSAGIEEDDMSCKLSDKELVKTIDPTINGSTYCLSLDSPGLFRCSETEIQFRVTQPVTIEYEVDSWSNYTEVLQNLRGGYEIIGSLFNIKSRLEPNVVSAVYLPHCLYLEGFEGDRSLIRCFHYKDDNMVLETPSRIEPMFAVLENPTFSSMGVILYPLNILKEKIMTLIPYRGMALVFCNTITMEDLNYRYRLHLYLLPRIQTVEKEVERYETRFSFQRIHKPAQTESLYSNKKYRITGPLIARVFPKTLLFESYCPSEIYPFTEISIAGKTNTEVNVSILPEDKDLTVWETVVSADEMLNVQSAMSRLSLQPGDCRHLPEQSVHFLDKHRADLIHKISVVDRVLDDLLDLNLITYEHHDIVLRQDTNAEQMRKLYFYVRSWGNDDKDKVYQSLRKHNYPIIRQLENEVPADHNEPHTSPETFKCTIY